MSYCRWSSQNYKSDVYVYADVRGGFTCHVAANRIVGEVPSIPRIGTVPDDEWMAAHRAQGAFLDKAKHEPIGLGHDGESFNEPDELAMVDRLRALRGLGYHVPEYAIEALLEEAAAQVNGPAEGR